MHAEVTEIFPNFEQFDFWPLQVKFFYFYRNLVNPSMKSHSWGIELNHWANMVSKEKWCFVFYILQLPLDEPGSVSQKLSMVGMNMSTEEDPFSQAFASLEMKDEKINNAQQVNMKYIVGNNLVLHRFNIVNMKCEILSVCLFLF